LTTALLKFKEEELWLLEASRGERLVAKAIALEPYLFLEVSTPKL